MKRIPAIITALVTLATLAGCVSDVPSERRIRREIQNYYSGLEFDRRPTRIDVMEITPAGDRVLAVVDVEGEIIHQVTVDGPKRFVMRHQLEFMWLGSEWKCTTNIPSEYGK